MTWKPHRIAGAGALALLVASAFAAASATAGPSFFRLTFVPDGRDGQRGKVLLIKDDNQIERMYVTYRQLRARPAKPPCPNRMSEDPGHRVRGRTVSKAGSFVVRTPRLPRGLHVMCVYVASGAERDEDHARARGFLVGGLKHPSVRR